MGAPDGSPGVIAATDRCRVETAANGVATLTLNEPRRLNALSSAMMAAIRDGLDRVDADPSARVVVIRAEGPGFCAGHDLAEIRGHRGDADRGRAFNEGLFAEAAALMGRIRGFRAPVIASVHGVAVAAGCELVATCDLAVAAETARFGVNGIDVGLFCSTPAVALARAVARKQALELLMTGRLIDAAEARAIGLVNRVVAADALGEETLALARTIAAKPPEVIALGKQTFYRQVGLAPDVAYAVAGAAMVANLGLEDAREGIDAFVEKRRPSWRREH